jgi:hypothetical protein
MFTRQKSKAVANLTANNPSGGIGSQTSPSEFSFDSDEDRKHPVKLGRSINKTVVAVPFESLPDDFGMAPLSAKNRHRKREAKEVVAAPLLEATAGEVARASNVTSEEVKVPVSLLVTKQETSRRIRNVADNHSKNTKKKAKAKWVEGKETDVFPLDDIEEQPKEETKKKAINVAEVGDDGPKTNADLLVFPFVSGWKIETATSSLKLCHFVNCKRRIPYHKSGEG